MNHDFAILNNGTRKMVDDFAHGELFVACSRGEIKRIVHVRQPRLLGGWRQRKSKPLTDSQQACLEGMP